MSNWIQGMWRDTRPLSPARAVMHPAWLLAVFILLVNDHIIKPAALVEPLAGKLSDFAGLLFFPVLLAALLRVRSRRGLWLTGGLVATVFAAINVSAQAAAAFDALVSTLVPFQTVVDPTDLLALVAIPTGLLLFEPSMRAAARPTRRMLETAAVTIGGLASMATSEPPCDDCWETTEFSQISLLNKTNELHNLRLRPLRSGVRFNCAQIEADPNAYLSDAVFGPPESWLVQSGQEIPIRPQGGGFDGSSANSGSCRAVLIQSDTTPDILVFWDASLPEKTFAFDADVPQEIPADPQTVVLDADYSRANDGEMHDWRERSDCGERADLCGDDLLEPLATIPAGTRYFWRSQSDGPLHFVRPSSATGSVQPISDQCAMPDASVGLAWEVPPTSELYVASVEAGRDGCHEVRLTRDLADTETEPIGWWVCAPFEALASLVPDATLQKRVAITGFREEATFSRGGYQGLQLSVVTLDDVGPVGLDTIYMSRGFDLPPEADFAPTYVPVEGCTPVEGACGQMAVPVDVELTNYSESLRPGESVRVGDVIPLEIFVVRAEVRPVIDPLCEAEDTRPVAARDTIGYIEAVTVRRDAGRQ